MIESPTLIRPKIRATDLSAQTQRLPAWQQWWPYVAIALVVTLFDLTQISNASVWFDESFSINSAYLSWGDWWRFIWTFGNQNMLLYYVILRAWLWLVGVFGITPSDAIVRFPSLVFSVSTLLVVFAMGRRFFSDTVAWIAVVFYAFSMNMLAYSHEARSYSLFCLLISIGWYCLFTLFSMTEDQLTPGALRWWLAYVGAMSLAVYAHLVGILDIATQIAFVAILILLPNPWQQRARKSMLLFGGAMLAILLLIFPIQYNAHIRGGGSNWLPIPRLQDFRLFFTDTVSGYNVRLTWGFYALVALGIGLTIGSFILRNNTRWREWLKPAYVEATGRLSGKVIGLTCWFLLPSLLAFAVSRRPLDLHVFYPRYQFQTLPALFLIIAVGLSVIPWQQARLGAIGLVSLVVLLQVPADFGSQSPIGFRPALQWMGQQQHSGDGVICLTREACAEPTDYYLNHVHIAGSLRFAYDAPGQFHWADSGILFPTTASVSAYVATHPRFFVITDQLVGSYVNSPDANAIRAWLAQHCTLISQSVNSAVTAQLYQLKTGG